MASKTPIDAATIETADERAVAPCVRSQPLAVAMALAARRTPAELALVGVLYATATAIDRAVKIVRIVLVYIALLGVWLVLLLAAWRELERRVPCIPRLYARIGKCHPI
jgi:stage V sporulation protein SpoVS